MKGAMRTYSFLVEVEAIQPDCEGVPNGSDQSLNSRIVGNADVIREPLRPFISRSRNGVRGDPVRAAFSRASPLTTGLLARNNFPVACPSPYAPRS